jgi:aarF domain-containing kinase
VQVELFSAQMFDWGFVHCDPHPGNIIIRARPGSSSSSKTSLKPVLRDPQLVLLDHGLYVTIRPTVKRQYASLWRALLTSDWDTIRNVTESWGVGEAGLFASAILMRPVKIGQANGSSSRAEKANEDPGKEPNAYEQSVRMKERLKRFLVDTDKMPKELIFLGRNMRYVDFVYIHLHLLTLISKNRTREQSVTRFSSQSYQNHRVLGFSFTRHDA